MRRTEGHRQADQRGKESVDQAMTPLGKKEKGKGTGENKKKGRGKGREEKGREAPQRRDARGGRQPRAVRVAKRTSRSQRETRGGDEKEDCPLWVKAMRQALGGERSNGRVDWSQVPKGATSRQKVKFYEKRGKRRDGVVR